MNVTSRTWPVRERIMIAPKGLPLALFVIEAMELLRPRVQQGAVNEKIRECSA